VKSKDGDRGDEETFDRTVEVRRRANERLGLDEPCRTLMAPKLREVPGDIGEPVRRGSLPGQGRLVAIPSKGPLREFSGSAAIPSLIWLKIHPPFEARLCVLPCTRHKVAEHSAAELRSG
jgi:hypothetical protein